MKTNNHRDPRLAGDNAKFEKAPYQAPVLRVYGAVNQLTAGKTGTASDGNSGMAMSM